MSLLDRTTAQYRSLRLTATANQLTELRAQAAANGLEYLAFALRQPALDRDRQSADRVACPGRGQRVVVPGLRPTACGTRVDPAHPQPDSPTPEASATAVREAPGSF